MDTDRTRVLGHPIVARAARWGVVAWSGIGVGAFAYLFFRYVLYPVRIIFPPLVVALILVYALNPVVSRLERRGMPRLLAALVTYVVGLGLIGIGLTYLIPVIAAQVQEFAGSVPDLVHRVQGWVAGIASRFGFEVSPDALTPESQQQVLAFFGRLLSFTRGLFHVALVAVLGPILAFYLVVDLPKLRRALEAFIPSRHRPEVQGVMRDIGRALGGFFRGQLLIALFVGIASSLGLWIVGLPYWALVGMISGLFNLIPLVGPYIGGILALFVAFTTSEPGQGLLNLDPGLPMALGSAIALTTVQQIDNHIMSPNIVARTVRLHPVTVMLALLAGGTLLGLWGMLLAVPTVAIAKILVLHAWDTRMTWPPPGPEQPPGEAVAAPSLPLAPAPAERSPGGWARLRGWFGGRSPGPRRPAGPRPPDRPRQPERTP